MINKIITTVYLFLKGIFGASLEDTVKNTPESISITKSIRQSFWDIYNVDYQDKIEYTNTYEDHHSNFKHLDDTKDERFGTVSEQVGLIYGKDGIIPLNAAEVYDMTYEVYEEYKAKVLYKGRVKKVTGEEINIFLNN